MVYNPAGRSIYAIGGFNLVDGGAIDAVERYDLENKEWYPLAPLNYRRLNCSACMVGTNHIFVFGGRNEDTFYDSVERLNIELNLWNLLIIKMPVRICNTFAFMFSEENIILMGGLKKFNVG